jgi:hypothetical protein
MGGERASLRLAMPLVRANSFFFKKIRADPQKWERESPSSDAALSSLGWTDCMDGDGIPRGISEA